MSAPGVDPWGVATGNTTPAPAPSPANQSQPALDPWSTPGEPVRDSPYLGMAEQLERSQAAADAWNKAHPDSPVTVDTVTSHAGAIGRYQVMPATAAAFGLDPKRLAEPAYNRLAANLVLNELGQRYHGDQGAIAVAYNAGPAAADRWLKAGRDPAVLPPETRDYVARATDPWAPAASAPAGAAPPPKGAALPPKALAAFETGAKYALAPSESSWWDLIKPNPVNFFRRMQRTGLGLAQWVANQGPPDPNIPLSPTEMYTDPTWGNTPEQVAARAQARAPLNQWFAKRQAEISSDIQANTPVTNPGSLKNYTLQVTQGVTDMLPALFVTALTRSPTAGAAIMAGQAGGDKYAEAIASGRTPEQASMDATFSAMVNGGMGLLPLHVLMKPGGSFLATTLKNAGAFGLQGITTEALQIGYDKGVVNPNMTLKEAWGRLEQAGIVSTLTGAFLGGGHAGLERAVNRFRSQPAPGPAPERKEPAAATGQPKPTASPNETAVQAVGLPPKPGIAPAPDPWAPAGEPPAMASAPERPFTTSPPAIADEHALEVARLTREADERANLATPPTRQAFPGIANADAASLVDSLHRAREAADQPPPAPPPPQSEEFGTAAKPSPVAAERPLPEVAAADGRGIPRRELEPDTAVTASGREVPVRYAVVEAAHLVPSQTPEGSPNPYFPAELQPRDRTRAVSQAQIASIAQNLNPRLLDQSANASDGAPIVSSGGVVESGNGRTLALQRAYAQDMPSAQAYRDYLAQRGYPVDGMTAPVLVRVREGEMTPADRQAFVREANQSGQLGYSATERAMSDAAAMPEHILDLYRGGEVEGAANRDFVRSFMRDAIPGNEHAAMIDANGRLSQQAIARVRAALLAKAYGDPDLVARIVENPDTNIKAIGGALSDAAADWAKMRARAADGEIPPALDQTGKLLEAVNLVAHARQEGRNVAEFVAQPDIFTGEAVDPDVEAWLRLMFRDTKDWTKPVGREKLADALQFYANEAIKAQVGPDLLGSKPVAAGDVLAAARRKQGYGDQPAAASASLSFGEDLRAPGGPGAGAGPQGAEAGRGQGFAEAGAEGAVGQDLKAGEYAPVPKEFRFARGARIGKTGATDLTTEFERFAGGAEGPQAVMSKGVQYVLDRGRKLGTEALVTLGAQPYSISEHQRNRVAFPPSLMVSLGNSRNRIVSVHNHPSSNSFSAGDISSLSNPGHAGMIVVGHDGDFHSATLVARITRSPTEAERSLRGAHQHASDAVQTAFDPHVGREMTVGVANKLFYHAVNRALDNAGLTDYESSVVVPPEVEHIFQRAVQHAAKTAAHYVDNTGALKREPLRSEPAYRRAEPIRPEDGVAGLLARVGRLAGDPGSRGGAGTGAGLPRPEYRKPVQLQLLEDDNRYEAASRGSAFDYLFKPNRVGKEGENGARSEVAPVMPLKQVNRGVISALHHDQVERAIVSDLPVKVVDDLAAVKLSPEDVFRRPNMIIGRLAKNHRRTVAAAVAAAADRVTADLRTKLRHALARGADEEVLPALRASDLSPREVVGLLAPKDFDHLRLENGGEGFGSAFERAVPPPTPDIAGVPVDGAPAAGALDRPSALPAGAGTEPAGLGATWLDRKALPARVAKLLDAHDRLVAGDEALFEDEDRFKTEPGAVDARDRPLPQTIMPGMERSASQLAHALETANRGRMRSKKEQKAAGGLFAEPAPEDKQGSLFETPSPYSGTSGFRETLRRQTDALMDLAHDAQMLLAPMARGTAVARATAKTFANVMRLARWHGQRMDTMLKDDFTPAQRRRMWEAADEESVARQQDQPTAGIGLSTLSPDERRAVLEQQQDAQNVWKAAQDQGMVSSNGLPSYVPRMMVEMADTGVRPLGSGDSARSIPGIGRNLRTRTSQMLQRKHLTSEETEAAGSSKFGTTANIVKDIRTLPLATMRLREAVAGRALINKIKEIGQATGDDTVVEGHDPSRGEDKWFHLNHPSFFTWRPKFIRDPESGEYVVQKDQAGSPILEKTPIWVRGDFEGPLKAVLSQDQGRIYGALMDMKGKAMTTIMYSPLIHNAVEWGRALPAMPGKVATFRIYFEGNRAKRDPETMTEAIMHGLVPIGHRGGYQDISSIATGDNIKAGRSWTAKALGAVPGLFSPRAKEAVYRAIDRMGDIWHNTLLWDRVADLQMGLYRNFRDDMVKKGYSPDTAQYVAAHFANRYAGALPLEAMSTISRKMANIVLFSRSYTLGNLGAMKDVVTGLPRDVQAQIEQTGGLQELQRVRSMSRRKALAILATDIALFYIANSMLQSGIAYIAGRKDLSDIEKGYVDRLNAELHHIGENPLALLNPFGVMQSLSATSENEPGREDRVFVGTDHNGTAIYARNPVGKIGEEFKNWLTDPIETFKKKFGTLARPTYQVITNDAGFGRHVYDPNAKGISGFAGNLGSIVSTYLGAQVPVDSIKSGWNALSGKGGEIDIYKTVGPLAGVTFSKGAPGGPAVGYAYQLEREHQAAISAAMPDIVEKIRNGDVQGARADMKALGMAPMLINYYVRTTLNPAMKLRSRRMRETLRGATPDQKQRFEQLRGGQQ